IMNKIYIIILTLTFNINYAQSERSIDETKSYITKIINDYGWAGTLTKNRLRADFEGDYLRIAQMNKDYTKPITKGVVYNFTNVYRYKGPIREPGDRAELIIWVDYLANEKTGRWKKGDFQFLINNYDVADQLMIAFQ